MKYNTRIIDAASGVITDRPMTDDEVEQYEADIEANKKRAARQAAAIADRAAAVASARAKLANLGLTDDEINAFLA